jgi:queuine tRNA-ribosyltransferase
MFDCILPTAMAQQGVAYTSAGRLEMRRGVYKFQDRPLDENCTCPCCSRYSRAYLHHLIKTGEYYGSSLIGIHNLIFYRNLMDSMRSHINAGAFLSFYNSNREILKSDDIEHPVNPPVSKKRKNLPSLGNYEVVKQSGGFYSIRHIQSGEIMHSVTNPLVEAKSLYIDQTDISSMLNDISDDNLVIWDVGLGAGTNAMAAVFECEKILADHKTEKGVRIISFENDLDSLRLSAENPALFPHVRHSAPSAILKHGSWVSDSLNIQWNLLEGDFADLIEKAEKPHSIFYDPFSTNTDHPLWSYSIFKRIFDHCKERPAKLLTYSGSTMVRGALIAAGFYTGAGAGTGPRTDTTAAFTSMEIKNRDIDLLGAEWLERFKRSSSKFSPDASENEGNEIEGLIFNHPQFSNIKGDR